MASIVVSSAGCEFVNGEYRLDGQFNGNHMFTCDETGLQLWSNHGEWRIGRTNDYYYLCDDAEPAGGAWRVASHHANAAAIEPVPKVYSGAVARASPEVRREITVQ